jgi:hypothetical protein
MPQTCILFASTVSTHTHALQKRSLR